MIALAIDDEATYVQKVTASILELNELIEEVVIPETWFFRDKKPFEVLNHHVKEVWNKENKAFLRLLSAPCSTGEEPYSLAMSLLNSGWPASKFQIIAVDISHRSLARAQQGVYTKNSFRVEDLEFRDRHFQEDGKEYILNKEIRSKVHFRQGNLLNPIFMGSLGVFDVIFCKNVLIYLDEKSRSQAISLLYKQLVSYGLLFVGHAEAGLFMNTQFIHLSQPQAFVFQKPRTTPIKTPPSFLARKRLPPDESVEMRFMKSQEKKFSPDLTVAKKYADQGRLKEAIDICEANLHEKGPSPQAYFLLGVTRDASGETENAVKMFRKAIYLDPDHLDSLIHLSLMAERSGDINSADALRQRIKRLQESQKKFDSGFAEK